MEGREEKKVGEMEEGKRKTEKNGKGKKKPMSHSRGRL